MVGEIPISNCRLCYEYNQKAQETDNPMYLKLRDDARYRAMTSFKDGGEFSGVVKEQNLLRICLNCNYEKSNIANLLDKLNESIS